MITNQSAREKVFSPFKNGKETAAKMTYQCSSSSSMNDLSKPTSIYANIGKRNNDNNKNKRCWSIRTDYLKNVLSSLSATSKTFDAKYKYRCAFTIITLCVAVVFKMMNIHCSLLVYGSTLVFEIFNARRSQQHSREKKNAAREEDSPAEKCDGMIPKLDSDAVQKALEELVQVTHKHRRSSYISVVLNAAQHYIESEQIVELAFSNLYNILGSNKQNCIRTFVQKDGINIISTAMKHHANNIIIQEKACSVYWSVIGGNSTNKSLVAQAGGIHLIIDAMKRHSDSLFFLEEACGVLSNLAVDSNNRLIIAQVGIAPGEGIVSIISAMENHSRSVVLQKRACGALSNLALNSDNRVTIAASGGVNAILTAMEEHSESSHAQEIACNALANLALDNMTNKRTIGQQGGIDAILKAMKHHPDAALLQKHACAALADLATNAGNSVRILRATNGIQVIIATMQRYLDSSVVQEKACIIFGNLAAIDVDSTICESGGIRSIISAMKYHTNSVGVQSKGCWALQELSQLLCSLVVIRRENPKDILCDASDRFPDECRGAAKSVLVKL